MQLHDYYFIFYADSMNRRHFYVFLHFSSSILFVHAFIFTFQVCHYYVMRPFSFSGD